MALSRRWGRVKNGLPQAWGWVGMYQALYRKYRPQTFSDVVGQRSVTETLRAQITGGKLSHAYLFTGMRGTDRKSVV